MDILSQKNVWQFGAIITLYASAETGLKITLAQIAGIQVADFMMLAEPYSSRDLKNVGKAFVKEREPNNDKLLQLFGDLGTFTVLRNLIAHSRWTSGVANGAIKPRKIDIRDDKLKLLGDAPTEAEWSEADLDGVIARIATLNERIKAYLVARDPSLGMPS